jgi:hypothetical protein
VYAGDSSFLTRDVKYKIIQTDIGNSPPYCVLDNDGDEYWLSEGDFERVPVEAAPLPPDIYEVDEDFIREGYLQACDKWQKRIRAKFPEIDFFNKSAAKKAVDAMGPFISEGSEWPVGIVEDDDEVFILVPLPEVNKEWTLDAFDYVKRFVGANEGGSPVHGGSVPDSINQRENLVIKFN